MTEASQPQDSVSGEENQSHGGERSPYSILEVVVSIGHAIHIRRCWHDSDIKECWIYELVLDVVEPNPFVEPLRIDIISEDGPWLMNVAEEMVKAGGIKVRGLFIIDQVPGVLQPRLVDQPLIACSHRLSAVSFAAVSEDGIEGETYQVAKDLMADIVDIGEWNAE